MALRLSSSLFFFLLLLVLLRNLRATVAMWCVARSEASNEALLRGLNYACAAGADCTPLQTNGLCFLPNTIQAHASYAFNSYFQRRYMAPGSCNFAGTATIAKTDPSYGSCVYPSSSSTAGKTPSTATFGGTPGTTTGNNPTPPTTTMQPLDNGRGNGLNQPGTSTSSTDGSGTSSHICVRTSLTIASSAVVLFFTF